MSSVSTNETLDAIRAVLAERGLSQRQFARQLGWSHMRVQRLLRGDTRLTVADLQTVSAALGVPVGQLLPAAEPTPGGAR